MEPTSSILNDVKTRLHTSGERLKHQRSARRPHVSYSVESLLLARLMGQYCVARCRLSASVVCRRRLSASSVVCNAGVWAVWRPTLHGGPVRSRPVRPISCSIISICSIDWRLALQCDGRWIWQASLSSATNAAAAWRQFICAFEAASELRCCAIVATCEWWRLEHHAEKCCSNQVLREASIYMLCSELLLSSADVGCDRWPGHGSWIAVPRFLAGVCNLLIIYETIKHEFCSNSNSWSILIRK